MNTYILLRNNKESSPLTLDELRHAALKSTDLIWVECQSVCWQHPHEIQELKNLVGNKALVSDTTETQTDSLIASSASLPIPGIQIEIVVSNNNEQIDFNKNEEPVNALSETNLSDMHKYAGIAVNETKQEQKITETINTKYSRPLDEIKEQYVKNLYEKEQHQKNKLPIQFPAQFKKIALYAGLVITGALLMFFINSIGGNKSKAQEKLVQQIKPVSTVETVAEPIETVSSPQENSIAQEPLQETNDAIVQNKTTLATKDNLPPNTEHKNIVIAEPIKEKIEKKNQEQPEVTASKPIAVENVSSKLSLNANDFVVGSFGGIRNLEITLHNESKYLLDKVTAELQYLNPEGIIIKTETLYFQSVPAGEKETVAVKKTNRGVKIRYKVIKVESKEVSNGIAGL